KKTPHQNAGEAPCKTTTRLLYDISGPGDAGGAQGDVLLAGHFKPSATLPLLTVYRATRDANNVTAVDAIDFTSSLWQVVAGGVGSLGFSATATGGQGTPSCSWTFKKDSQATSLTASTCSGTLSNVTPGSYEGTVTITDSSGSTCEDTVTTAPVNVLAGLDVN